MIPLVLVNVQAVLAAKLVHEDRVVPSLDILILLGVHAHVVVISVNHTEGLDVELAPVLIVKLTSAFPVSMITLLPVVVERPRSFIATHE